MFHRLGQFVVRRRLLVIAGWLGLVVALRWIAPSWDSVTHDGDLAYLPASAASVRGEKLLAQAFPEQRQKSQIVVVVEARHGKLNLNQRPVQPTGQLTSVTKTAAQSADTTAPHGVPAGTPPADLPTAGISPADAALADSNPADDSVERSPQHLPTPLPGEAIDGRDGQYQGDELGGELTDAQVFLELEQRLRASLGERAPFIDIWSALKPAGPDASRTSKGVLAERLQSSDGQAGLLIVQLSTEFMATANMPLFESVLNVLDEVRGLPGFPHDRLELGVCGSAGIGADMLTAARESIRRTEVTTVVLVVLILLVVYRAPLLTLVPIVTISASVMVACDLVALLTHYAEQSGTFEFKVFKTTKIFIVVIMFGAGTDFCLFLIARFREELCGGATPRDAASTSLARVGEALLASAMTTVGGLGMMAFADFGKFRYSGPALALCMGVALVASCTLAPALISIIGRHVFWPWNLESGREVSRWRLNFWRQISRRVTKRPGLILASCVLLLGPLAFQGLFIESSYDLLDELSAGRPSLQGTQMLYRHFDRGDTGPVVVMAHQPQSDFRSVDGEDAIYELTEYLAGLPGVARVRSLTRPLGDEPPERFGLFGAGEQEGRVLAAEDHYVSGAPPLAGKVTRFDIVTEFDPFSPQSAQVLAEIRQALGVLSGTKSEALPPSGLLTSTALASEMPAEAAAPVPADWRGAWQGAQFEFLGPTVATTDLRDVTTRDQRRIQVLCAVAVLLVLLLILRRPLICVYLILSVVFSFLVAIGATELVFRGIYGPEFAGLDWKVPLFLYVILVAIGEDYNIYLATRVFEEQERLGPLGGLRAGMQHTGGIITSCGLIMAGTFISMMTGSLRAMLELGFALSLGVLLDTFLVRTVLVPAFLALLLRWQHGRAQRVSVATPQS